MAGYSVSAQNLMSTLPLLTKTSKERLIPMYFLLLVAVSRLNFYSAGYPLMVADQDRT